MQPNRNRASSAQQPLNSRPKPAPSARALRDQSRRLTQAFHPKCHSPRHPKAPNPPVLESQRSLAPLRPRLLRWHSTSARRPLICRAGHPQVCGQPRPPMYKPAVCSLSVPSCRPLSLPRRPCADRTPMQAALAKTPWQNLLGLLKKPKTLPPKFILTNLKHTDSNPMPQRDWPYFVLYSNNNQCFVRGCYVRYFLAIV